MKDKNPSKKTANSMVTNSCITIIVWCINDQVGIDGDLWVRKLKWHMSHNVKYGGTFPSQIFDVWLILIQMIIHFMSLGLILKMILMQAGTSCTSLQVGCEDFFLVLEDFWRYVRSGKTCRMWEIEGNIHMMYFKGQATMNLEKKHTAGTKSAETFMSVSSGFPQTLNID